MITFLKAKMGFGPLIVFWTLMGMGRPALAVFGGLAFAVGVNAINRVQGIARNLDSVVLAMLAALAAIWFYAPYIFKTHGVWLSFLILGVISVVSAAIKKPWSMDFARDEFSGQAATPQFLKINQTFTVFWGVLFGAMALAHALDAPPELTSGFVGFGAIVTVSGPKLALWLEMRKLSAQAETYHWPAPNFKAARDAGNDCGVVVIGAGIGGLTAAALLAHGGLKVKIFEHQVSPGGFCHDYPRKAHFQGAPILYRFDAGPHDFSSLWEGGTVSSLLKRLKVQSRVQWARVGHRFFGDHGPIDVDPDWRGYARQLARLFPQEGDNFLKFFEVLDEILSAMYFCAPSRGGVPGSPTTTAQLLEYPSRFPTAIQWMDRPFDDFLNAFIKTPAARKLLNGLSGYIGDGSEPFSVMQMAPIFGYFLRGGFYPVGGTSVFASALVSAVEQAGGELRLKTPVRKILIEKGRACGVELASGEIVRSAAVVSNADLKKTFFELLPENLAPKDFYARLRNNPPSPSAFCVQLGVDYVPDAAPSIHVQGDAAKGEISVGVTVLSLLDPSAAPKNHSTVQIIRLVPHAEAQTWFPPGQGTDWKAYRRSTEYLERKKAQGDLMIAAAERALPGLRDHIVFRIDASPVTYARYNWSSEGAIYGMSQKAQLKGARSPVRNLAIAGGGNSGSGVEAAMISGAQAAEVLSPGLLTRKA